MAESAVPTSRIDLRPMGIGDILDTTFRLYRARFATFLTIALVSYVPYALLMGSFAAMEGGSTADQFSGGPAEINPIALLGRSFGTIVFVLVVWPLTQGALIHNISSGYLGTQLGALESYSRAKSRIFKLLGTQILVGLIVMLGFVLLIVPGVIFSLWYLVVPAVVMLENVTGGAALRRSKELMSGNLSKAFSLLVVVGLLQMVMGLAAGGIIGLTIKNKFTMEFMLTIIQALIVPIQLTPIILLYYDLRIRKEAFDLEQLAIGLGASPPCT